MPAAARGLSALAALAQPWLLRWWKDPVREQALRDRRRAVASRAGIPQVMIRQGYGLSLPATPRRAVAEVVRRVKPHPFRAESLAVRPSVGTAPTGHSTSAHPAR
jgi:hypothetical protein